MSEQIIDMIRCAGGNHVTLTIEDDGTKARRTIPMLWADFVAGDIGKAYRERGEKDGPIVAGAVVKAKAELDKGGGFAEIKAATVLAAAEPIEDQPVKG